MQKAGAKIPAFLYVTSLLRFILAKISWGVSAARGASPLDPPRRSATARR
ncbi:MAG: hypothetical protein ACD_54C00093G0004, partial [uncultured bacterium]